MRYYLSDFQRIGAIFIPGQPEKVTTKVAVLYGTLFYHGEKIPVKVRAAKNDCARIVSVLGESKKSAFRNLQVFRRIRRNAFSSNTNNLRNIILLRSLYTCIWSVCLLLQIVSLCLCSYLIVVRNRVVAIALLYPLILLYLFMIRRKNVIIPYRGGVDFGK